MILAVDFGKTSRRPAAGGLRAEGPGAPGLTAPGSVRGAEAAILLLAGVDAAEAAVRLDRARGRVRDALGGT